MKLGDIVFYRAKSGGSGFAIVRGQQKNPDTNKVSKYYLQAPNGQRWTAYKRDIAKDSAYYDVFKVVQASESKNYQRLRRIQKRIRQLTREYNNLIENMIDNVEYN